MMLGAGVGLSDWWIWNQIPVFLGNFVGSALGTGLLFYAAQKTARMVRSFFAASASGRHEERKREVRVL